MPKHRLPNVAWSNEALGGRILAKIQAEADRLGQSQADVIRDVLRKWTDGELVPAGASPRKRGRKEET